MWNADKSVFSKILGLVFLEAPIKYTFMVSLQCHNERNILKAAWKFVNLEVDACRVKKNFHSQQRKTVAGILVNEL